jgi:DNA primase
LQKHLTVGFPETKEGREIYAMVEDVQGLLGLVQMGVLEIHRGVRLWTGWKSRIG